MGPTFCWYSSPPLRFKLLGRACIADKATKADTLFIR